MKKTEHTIDRFRSTWNSKRVASLLALMLLVTWLLIPAAAFAQEPTPRATPTPVVLLELTPSSGMPGQVVKIRGYGFFGAAQVNVTWDGDSLIEDVSVRPDGSFETQFEIPSDTAGEHVLRVLVEGDPDPWAEAVFDLFLPTATPTMTNTPTVPPTSTSIPTSTPRPTNTYPPTLIPSPTNTPLATMTATVRPTLRPATPILPTAAATATYVYRAPTSTTAPVYVTPALPATATPLPTDTPLPAAVAETATPATETVEPANTSAPSGTETAPAEQTATATSTTTVSLAAGASATPTATITPLATEEQLSNTGIGPFVMVLVGGVFLGAGALGLRHLRANVLT